MGKTDSPLISVVLPTYNRAHLLSRAVDSVIRQTYPHFELFIVDDHSTDQTPSVVKEYEDERIKFIKNKRKRGAPGARNTGIEASRGRYVAFLDSDDEWYEDKLQRQVNYLSNHPDTDLVYTGLTLVRSDGNQRTIRRPRRQHYFRTLLKENCIGSVSSVMIRKDGLYEVGLFDEDLPARQDLDLWLRVAQHFTIASISQPLIKKHELDAAQEQRVYNLDNRIKGSRLILSKYKSHYIQHKPEYASRLYELAQLTFRNRDPRCIYYMSAALFYKFLSFFT